MAFPDMKDPSGLRMKHYQEFMEQYLGIPASTPLADCRVQTIRAAGRVPGGPFAAVLAYAAEEAHNFAPPRLMPSNPLVGVSRPPPPSGPTRILNSLKPKSLYPYPLKSISNIIRPKPRFIPAASLRRMLDQAVSLCKHLSFCCSS
jgi:hypothetical protein